MNTTPDPAHPQMQRRKTMWPGLIWSIPLAAFIVVSYLGIHAFTHRGEVVTVTFRRAADARPNDTKVLYQGVETGHLIKILPNPDGKRLDFQLRLLPEAEPGLNSNARFWLIGANPNLADLSSLKAVVSGVAIGYAPGDGGTPTTEFEGLDKAPTVLPGDRGTRYLLDAHTLGSIREGSGVLFHGQPIGKVTDVKFNGPSGFRVEIFVFQPYDVLIKPGARFWRMSPLRLSLAGGGLNATLAPASTLLSGGIDLEIDMADAASTPSPANAEFTLYANHAAARQGLSGPTARYQFAFSGAAGDLDEDAAVTLLGFQIGEVEATHLAYDADGKPITRVTAVLYPRQLAVPKPTPESPDAWQAATDVKLRQLLKFGYRARLQQTPALVGNQSIALVQIKGVAGGELGHEGENPGIPSAPGSASVDDIAAQADQILAKINSVPITEIGRNLQVMTARLGDTSAQVNQLLTTVQPQVGPLLDKLNRAATDISGTAHAAQQLLDGGAQDTSLPEAIDQLTGAARSIHNLADYLDRHPDALIRGKRPD